MLLCKWKSGLFNFIYHTITDLEKGTRSVRTTLEGFNLLWCGLSFIESLFCLIRNVSVGQLKQFCGKR